MTQAARTEPLRRRRRVAARIVLALLVAGMLAGCGKKGDPLPPPGEPNTFPRAYPHE
jgi:predicted small lipoprotein YifL